MENKTFDLINIGEEFKGNVKIASLIYAKKNNGYSVYEVLDNNGLLFKISGIFTEPLIKGASYKICGLVGIYKGEKQITGAKAMLIEENPTNIAKYLESLDPGFAAFSEDIAKTFKERTIDVIKNNPEELIRKIPLITKRDCDQLKKSVIYDERRKNATEILLSFKLSKEEINDIFRKYGDELGNELEGGIYFLAGKKDIFTFEKCDAAALPNGTRLDDKARIKYGILYVLYKEAASGRHTFVKRADLYAKVLKTLSYYISLSEKEKIKDGKYTLFGNTYKVPEGIEIEKEKKILLYKPGKEELAAAMQKLLKAGAIVSEKERYYLKVYYDAEKIIADRIQALNTGRRERAGDIFSYLDVLCKEKGYILEEKQKEAVCEILKYKSGVFCLSGGPGTGKTFLVNIILSALDMRRKKENIIEDFVLLAPTGRAAQILSESTGYETSTIHRKLGLISDFLYEKINYIFEDVVIIDECSMIDMKLGAKVFEAIEDDKLVILVGDVNQLPAIGAGNFFSDIIRSKAVPVFTLDVVKRQKGNSAIIDNATRIITGKDVKSDKEKGDALFIKLNTPPEVFARIKSFYLSLMEKWGLTPSEIQILTPTKIGGIGSESINIFIQGIINPTADETKRVYYKTMEFFDDTRKTLIKDKTYINVGDKVINTVNDYSAEWYEKISEGNYIVTSYGKGIYNGEIGIVEDIISNERYGKNYREVVVNFGDKYVLYKNLYSLELAYALTVHKSQGSQWPCVIIPIVKSKGRLTRNLFYTALTRAKENCFVIGQEDAIKLAIDTVEKEVNSSLKYFLRGE